MSFRAVQGGGGLNNIGPIFKNIPIYQKGYGTIERRPQRGRGLGSVFGHLYRYLKPLLTKSVKALGHEVLSATGDILDDNSGAPLAQIIKSRGERSVENLKRKADEKLKAVMSGSGAKKLKKKPIYPNLAFQRPIKKERKLKSKKQERQKKEKKRKKRANSKKKKRKPILNDIFS